MDVHIQYHYIVYVTLHPCPNERIYHPCRLTSYCIRGFYHCRCLHQCCHQYYYMPYYQFFWYHFDDDDTTVRYIDSSFPVVDVFVPTIRHHTKVVVDVVDGWWSWTVTMTSLMLGWDSNVVIYHRPFVLNDIVVAWYDRSKRYVASSRNPQYHNPTKCHRVDSVPRRPIVVAFDHSYDYSHS